MKNRILSAALVAAALSLGATPALASEVGSDVFASEVGPDGLGHELRIVNNHVTEVRVFVRDADGRSHHVGRVRRGQYKVLQLSDEITVKGPVSVEFFPADPSWSPMADNTGIRTSALDLGDGDSVTAFLEASLTSSIIEVGDG